MDDHLGLTPRDTSTGGLASLNEVNGIIGRYGLVLSSRQLQTMVEKRSEALRATGRIEFGPGIEKKLMMEFCDSPYIGQANIEETILDLIDAFYYFKNESEDSMADDELIGLMRHYFDTICQGAIEYLTGTTLEELCRQARNGFDDEEQDDQY